MSALTIIQINNHFNKVWLYVQIVYEEVILRVLER